MPETKINGWETWGKHVIMELEANSKEHEQIMDDLSTIKVELAMLKIKSGIWGAMAGMIPAAIAIIVMFIKGIGQ